MKEIVVIGGPNGAGKTTAAGALLPNRLRIAEFVNADEIAKGLSPFNSDAAAVAAGRIMLQRMQMLTQGNQSFALETTCAGHSQFRLLSRCRESGWRIMLLFLWLPSPRVAVERVARRVREGGHAVPIATIERRYWLGLENLKKYYLPVADIVAIYDNSDAGRVLVAEKTPESVFIVHDEQRWKAIEKTAR